MFNFFNTKKNMKNLKWKIVTLCIAIVTVYTACTKDFLDVNKNPNALQNANSQEMLSPVLASVCYTMGMAASQVLGCYWSQYWTLAPGGPQYKSYEEYNIEPDDFDNRFWGYFYSRTLMNAKTMKLKAKADEKYSLYLMGAVMETYAYQILVDLFDNVPYSQALKMNDAVDQPKFDEGKSVYEGMIKNLNEALQTPYKKGFRPGKEDIFFEGNMDKWEQFANTLKLKIYLRQSKNNLMKDSIAALFAKNNFLTVDVAITQFTDQGSQRNPQYETDIFLHGNNDNVASETVVEFLKTNKDTARLAKLFYLPKKGTDFKGLKQGNYMKANEDLLTADNFSRPIVTATTPVYLMTAAESYFLQAEAVARGYATGDAKSLYERGIVAAFARLGLSAAKADEVYADNNAPYNFDKAADKIQAIATQKWLSMTNIQGIESFIENVRLGFPTFQSSVSSKFPAGLLPKRLPYPKSEVDNNPNISPYKNNANIVFEPVWWAK